MTTLILASAGKTRADHLELRGHTNQLHSSAVIALRQGDLWRGRRTSTMTMKVFVNSHLNEYMNSNQSNIDNSVCGYNCENEDVNLCVISEPDYCKISSLSLVELLGGLLRVGAFRP